MFHWRKSLRLTCTPTILVQKQGYGLPMPPQQPQQSFALPNPQQQQNFSQHSMGRSLPAPQVRRKTAQLNTVYPHTEISLLCRIRVCCLYPWHNNETCRRHLGRHKARCLPAQCSRLRWWFKRLPSSPTLLYLFLAATASFCLATCSLLIHILPPGHLSTQNEWKERESKGQEKDICVYDRDWTLIEIKS